MISDPVVLLSSGFSTPQEDSEHNNCKLMVQTRLYLKYLAYHFIYYFVSTETNGLDFFISGYPKRLRLIDRFFYGKTITFPVHLILGVGSFLVIYRKFPKDPLENCFKSNLITDKFLAILIYQLPDTFKQLCRFNSENLKKSKQYSILILSDSINSEYSCTRLKIQGTFLTFLELVKTIVSHYQKKSIGCKEIVKF